MELFQNHGSNSVSNPEKLRSKIIKYFHSHREIKFNNVNENLFYYPIKPRFLRLICFLTITNTV